MSKPIHCIESGQDLVVLCEECKTPIYRTTPEDVGQMSRDIPADVPVLCFGCEDTVLETEMRQRMEAYESVIYGNS